MFHRVEYHESATLLKLKVEKETAELKIKEIKAQSEATANSAELEKQKAIHLKAQKGITVSDDPVSSRGERRAPLTRPSITEDCTESDWSFFLASWGRYVDACKLEGVELRSPCG